MVVSWQIMYPSVTVTHLPTGITATCNTFKSPHRAREIALKLLQAKLKHMQYAEQEPRVIDYAMEPDQYPNDIGDFRVHNAELTGWPD